jgi:hypothetical protein
MALRRALFLVLLGVGMLLPAAAGAGAEGGVCAGCAKVLDGYVERVSDGSLRVTWVMDRTVYPRVFILKEPRRLVVDIEPAWTEGLPRLTAPAHPLLRGPIRTAWHAEPRRLRCVLDLLPDGLYDVTQDLFLNPPEQKDGARFVLGVSRVSGP